MKNAVVSLFTTVLIFAVLSACSSNTSQKPSTETESKKESRVSVFTSNSSEPMAKAGDTFSSDNIIYTVKDENLELTLECGASEKAPTPGFVISLFCNNLAQKTINEKQKEGYVFNAMNTEKPFGKASDALQSLPAETARKAKLIRTFPYKK